MKAAVTPTPAPSLAGSLTPGLEGAPCSASPHNRMNPVISPREPLPAAGKEGSLSKP